MDNVKISKIEIQIGDTTVLITPKQARELLDALQELVGEKPEKVTERIIEKQPRYWWEYPRAYWGTGQTFETVSGFTTYNTSSDTVKISVNAQAAQF